MGLLLLLLLLLLCEILLLLFSLFFFISLGGDYNGEDTEGLRNEWNEYVCCEILKIQ